MRIGVLVGYDEQKKECGVISCGDPADMVMLAKTLTIENDTGWPQVRLMTQFDKRWNVKKNMVEVPQVEVAEVPKKKGK